MTDWDRLVRDYHAVVFATAWRVLGHAADAEDVVQEVFLQAHQMQKYEEIRCWEALLRRLASCRALDRLRARRPTTPLDACDPAVTREDPAALAIERELSERLRGAIARLPRREASVFCLRYFDELSYEDIAASLDISSGAVATALHKARAKLERFLGEGDEEDEADTRAITTGSRRGQEEGR